MFRIEMLPAGEGDCLWIEYGNMGELHRILIDGGTAGTYKRLKKRIEQLPENERGFELLIITHIDADHIAGALKLVEKGVPGLSFDDIWFNGWRHLPRSGLESLGPVQGEKLTNQILTQDLQWNARFGKSAVAADPDNDLQGIPLPGGMKVTLLSPTQKQLADLKPVWKKELKKAGLDPEEPVEEKEDLDTSPSRLERLGAVQLPDVDSLAQTPFDPDGSEANGSSIAILAEYNGKSALFSGDAFPEVLTTSIKKLCSQRGLDHLPLDAFKIPHHGSKSNVSTELLNEVQCSKFLVSTNGARHHHPDQVALSRILKHGEQSKRLVFNYKSKDNEIWDNQTLKSSFNYTVEYPANNENGMVIKLD